MLRIEPLARSLTCSHGYIVLDYLTMQCRTPMTPASYSARALSMMAKPVERLTALENTQHCAVPLSVTLFNHRVNLFEGEGVWFGSASGNAGVVRSSALDGTETPGGTLRRAHRTKADKFCLYISSH